MFNILRVLMYLVMILVAVVELTCSKLAKKYDDERWNDFLPLMILFLVWKLFPTNFQLRVRLASLALSFNSLIQDLERDSESYFKRGGDKKNKKG
jgi:hypothetical protein